MCSRGLSRRQPQGVRFAQAAPSFELAAIRENTSGASGGSTRIEPGGRWIATNISLASLITIAHGLNNDDRVLNVPDWTRMRALLRERFGMQAHVEQRELPVYNLTVRSDGRLGTPAHSPPPPSQPLD